MGQYYHQIAKTKNGKLYFRTQIEEFHKTNNFDCYNGLKLMEHSWWKNQFCKRFASMLVDNPTRVAWVGDYAEDEECKPFGFTVDEVHGREDEDYTYPSPTDFSMDSVKYLVNNTKKIYIDLAEYKEKSTFDDGWCPFPISLLTAIGNGRGGGDYHDCYPNFNIVGSWAYDEIYLTNKLPDGYTKEDDIYFKEVKE
jgi:hypothetical protein